MPYNDDRRGDYRTRASRGEPERGFDDQRRFESATERGDRFGPSGERDREDFGRHGNFGQERGYGQQRGYGGRGGFNEPTRGFGDESGYDRGRGESRSGVGGQQQRRSGQQGQSGSPDAVLLYDEYAFTVPTPNQDDHYRSWRDRQIQQMDREYQQFCREREEQFQRDFDNWRKNRRSGENAQLTDQSSQRSSSGESASGRSGSRSSGAAGSGGSSKQRETAQAGSSSGSEESSSKSKSRS